MEETGEGTTLTVVVLSSMFGIRVGWPYQVVVYVVQSQVSLAVGAKALSLRW